MPIPHPRSKRAEAWAFVYRGLFDVPDEESGDESNSADE